MGRIVALTVAAAIALVVALPSDAAVPLLARVASYPADFTTDVALADFNGDGILDVVADGDPLSLRLGLGNGKFGSAARYSTPSACSLCLFEGLATGDVNGDGKEDLLTTVSADPPTPAYDRVQVRLGDGAGRLSAPLSVVAGTQPDALALGDLNGDGKLDLVVGDIGDTGDGSGSPAVTVLLGTGNGAYTQLAAYPGATPTWAVALADLNGDGKLDLVRTYPCVRHTCDPRFGRAAVRLGTGDGGFGGERTFTVGAGPVAIAVGDLTEDGRPDLVTANEGFNLGGDLSVLRGRGDGTFGGSRRYRAVGVTDVAVSDLDSDGHLDLVATTDPPVWPGGVVVLPGKGAAGFGLRARYPTGGSSSVAIGRLNADARPDVVAGDIFDVKVLLNGSGPKRPCVVPGVYRLTLRAAERRITSRGCRVGLVRRAHWTGASRRRAARGRVLLAVPGAGLAVPAGTRVELTVSLGRRPHQ